MREILSDALRFPEQRRMQPNPFHNLGMLRKKKLGLVFPGSDGNEIGFLTGVVQNALQKRSCGREHLGRFGPVIGLEQRVEKPREIGDRTSQSGRGRTGRGGGGGRSWL